MGRLIECRACGHDYSKRAKKCPECGEPQVSRKAQAIGCLGLALIVGIWLYEPPPSKAEVAAQELAEARAENERKQKAAAREAARREEARGLDELTAQMREQMRRVVTEDSPIDVDECRVLSTGPVFYVKAQFLNLRKGDRLGVVQELSQFTNMIYGVDGGDQMSFTVRDPSGNKVGGMNWQGKPWAD